MRSWPGTYFACQCRLISYLFFFCLQINQTTLETLDRVKSLQDQLTLVQAELINIRNDIKDLKCSVETARLDTDTRAIQVSGWHDGTMKHGKIRQ